MAYVLQTRDQDKTMIFWSGNQWTPNIEFALRYSFDGAVDEIGKWNPERYDAKLPPVNLLEVYY